MDKRKSYVELKQKEAEIEGVVCLCKLVTERKIRRAVREGRRRFVSVKQATEAGSGCGLCQPLVEDIITDELRQIKAR